MLAHRVAQLPGSATEGDTFRRLVSGSPASWPTRRYADLGTTEVVVDTPVVAGAPAWQVSEVVLLVPILRAGLGMVQAIQEIVPLTEVAHVGLRRDEATLTSDVYLNRLPRDLERAAVLICDPMLATGGSLAQVCDLLEQRGSARLVALCIIASAPGVAAFEARHPRVPVYCAALDPTLNEAGYIVPGLGDAGDRLLARPTSCTTSSDGRVR